MKLLPVFLVFAFLLGAIPVKAEICPTEEEDGAPTTYHGTLVYHDELRQWIGLKLDEPVCGQDEIQPVFADDKKFFVAKSLSDCKVSVSGSLMMSPTGYYSTAIAIFNAEIISDEDCHPAKVERNPSGVVTDPRIKSYRAEIQVDTRGSGHLDVHAWQAGRDGAELAPWQPYISYHLTGGGDVVWFGCADGFRTQHIRQKPEANFDYDAATQQSMALLQENTVNVFSFDCRR